MVIATINHNEQYQNFQRKRDRLSEIIQKQQNLVHLLNMTSWQEILRRLHERVREDNFKVLVLGEFKRGKSTFINALLGNEILPAYAKPCTAIINEVKWGDAPKALLHYPQSDDIAKPSRQVP